MRSRLPDQSRTSTNLSESLYRRKVLVRSPVSISAQFGLRDPPSIPSMKPEILEKIAAGIPAGRLCEPEEIGHAALYLLENDYMNGRVLEIDGAARL